MARQSVLVTRFFIINYLEKTGDGGIIEETTLLFDECYIEDREEGFLSPEMFNVQAAQVQAALANLRNIAKKREITISENCRNELTKQIDSCWLITI